MRSPKNAYTPIIDDQGNKANFNSCFVTNEAIVAFNNHLYVLTFNLGKPMMQNAVLIVQDQYNSNAKAHTD